MQNSSWEMKVQATSKANFNSIFLWKLWEYLEFLRIIQIFLFSVRLADRWSQFTNLLQNLTTRMNRSYVKIREDLSFFLSSIKIFGKCTKRLKVRKSNPTLRSYYLCASDPAGILYKLPGKLHYLYIMQAIWCPVCYIISKGN